MSTSLTLQMASTFHTEITAHPNSTNWAAASSMGVELDDNIDLGQGLECARTTYGFSNTSCHKIDLLGIGTMFD
jgi:hypothetical protein